MEDTITFEITSRNESRVGVSIAYNFLNSGKNSIEYRCKISPGASIPVPERAGSPSFSHGIDAPNKACSFMTNSSRTIITMTTE